MNITPEEAQAALNDIQDATTKANNVVNTWAYYMLLWGVIWTIGFLATQFQPHWSLDMDRDGCYRNGRLCHHWYHTRETLAPSSRVTRGFHQLTARHLLRCALLFCHSLADHFSTHANANRDTLDHSSNVWFYHRWLWIHEPLSIIVGVGITFMSVVGYYLLPQYFWVWAAVFAGLPLIGVSIYYLRKQ